MNNKTATKRSAWWWIPTLYMAEGVPYYVVNTLATFLMMSKNMDKEDITLHTSLMYLPWMIKPFWSPILDLFGRKRMWIVMMQVVVALVLATVAFSIPMDCWLQSLLACLWICAFASATHDIAADGLYILALDTSEQSFYAGIRNTFYRISTVLCGWGCLYLVGSMKKIYAEQGILTEAEASDSAWTLTFIVLAAFFIFVAVYHIFALPKAVQDKPSAGKVSEVFTALQDNFKTFANKFTPKEFAVALLFIFFYRLGEAQLTKIEPMFLKDELSKGGLGLMEEQIANINGLVGVASLIVGGILGGIVVSKYGLKRLMFPMLLFMNVPNVVYVLMSYYQVQSMPVICTAIGIEQFGYGFGFTAFTLYLIYISQGKYSTTHYAICTGLMALGMMLPGMISGYMLVQLGYTNFFIWVCICSIPPFFIAPLLKIDKDFGIK